MARLSQRIQGDTVLLLLSVQCANESACANPPCATATAVHPSSKDLFFFFLSNERLRKCFDILETVAVVLKQFEILF